MAKVIIDSTRKKQTGYVMTERDLPGAKRRVGRPRKVKGICVRRTYGTSYTYGWNPALKRKATAGMKKSQGLMHQAAAIAKRVWANPERKLAWENKYRENPGKYRSAWMMLVGWCMEWIRTSEKAHSTTNARPMEVRPKWLNVPIKLSRYTYRSLRRQRCMKRIAAQIREPIFCI